jgi:hypothetical protein
MPPGKLMPSRSNKLAIWGSIALLTVCALSINIALPMTVRVVDDKTGQPIEGAFVVSYLAIRHPLHNFDDGKSVIQESVTDVNGDAKLQLSVSWIFVNRFQDYKSKLLIFKPNTGFNITNAPFHIVRVFASFATLETKEIRVSQSIKSPNDTQSKLEPLASELVMVCMKVPTNCAEKYLPKFLSAFKAARIEENK